MARMTAKYMAAVVIGVKEYGTEAMWSISADDLYKKMEADCWKWNSSTKDWEKQERPVTSSVFGDDETGSGIYRLRIMAHPAECESFVSDVTAALKAAGYKIADVSEPYPNRRGVGTRVYITLAKGG